MGDDEIDLSESQEERVARALSNIKAEAEEEEGLDPETIRMNYYRNYYLYLVEDLRKATNPKIHKRLTMAIRRLEEEYPELAIKEQEDSQLDESQERVVVPEPMKEPETIAPELEHQQEETDLNSESGFEMELGQIQDSVSDTEQSQTDEEVKPIIDEEPIIEDDKEPQMETETGTQAEAEVGTSMYEPQETPKNEMSESEHSNQVNEEIGQLKTELADLEIRKQRAVEERNKSIGDNNLDEYRIANKNLQDINSEIDNKKRRIAELENENEGAKEVSNSTQEPDTEKTDAVEEKQLTPEQIHKISELEAKIEQLKKESIEIATAYNQAKKENWGDEKEIRLFDALHKKQEEIRNLNEEIEDIKSQTLFEDLGEPENLQGVTEESRANTENTQQPEQQIAGQMQSQQDIHPIKAEKKSIWSRFINFIKRLWRKKDRIRSNVRTTYIPEPEQTTQVDNKQEQNRQSSERESRPKVEQFRDEIRVNNPLNETRHQGPSVGTNVEQTRKGIRIDNPLQETRKEQEDSSGYSVEQIKRGKGKGIKITNPSALNKRKKDDDEKEL